SNKERSKKDEHSKKEYMYMKKGTNDKSIVSTKNKDRNKIINNERTRTKPKNDKNKNDNDNSNGGRDNVDNRNNNNDKRKIKEKVEIKAINIQGMSNMKLTEVEDMLNNENTNIICLTETQLKVDRINVSRGVKKIDSMREEKDKKGGGLMILYKETDDVKLEKRESNSKDILEVFGKIKSTVLRVIIIYMDCGNNQEAKVRNRRIAEELENKLESRREEPTIIVGDFNAHLGYLGYQEENENGKRINELINRQGLTLINIDEKCSGVYTWQRGEQKSVIDFVLTNENACNIIKKMHIDEEKEECDISDHNLITITLDVKYDNGKKFNNKKWKEITYIKDDADSIIKYINEIENKITDQINNIEKFNKILKEASDKHLKKTYKRRINKENKIEQPWITEEIRQGIKKRKEWNRKQRNTVGEERERFFEQYLEQKFKVQRDIKEEITKHEKKKTEEVKKGGKKLFDYIRILKGERTSKE
ncbi:MAG: endonuclease/exonuclease/phosphatase family protein, partial [Pseudomonadota bacterium]